MLPEPQKLMSPSFLIAEEKVTWISNSAVHGAASEPEEKIRGSCCTATNKTSHVRQKNRIVPVSHMRSRSWCMSPFEVV